MSQFTESKLSYEDSSLIEANHLGFPLDIYRLKQGYIRFTRWSGLFIFTMSIILFAIAIIADLLYWPQFQVQGSSYFAFLLSSYVFPPLMGGLSGLLGGLVVLCIAVPQVQRERIIVCEQGLLQIRRKIRSNQVVAVLWEDIRAVRKSLFGEYYIVRREGEAITLSVAYQRIGELIALIRQRSGVV